MPGYLMADAVANYPSSGTSPTQVGPCHICWEMGHLKYSYPNKARTLSSNFLIDSSNSMSVSMLTGEFSSASACVSNVIELM